MSEETTPPTQPPANPPTTPPPVPPTDPPQQPPAAQAEVVPPVNPPTQPPTLPPSSDVDVNQMIANIEAETQKQQEELRKQIMGEAEKVFTEKMSKQQEESNKVLAEMRTQLDALNKASDEQKKVVIEDYKVKLAEQAKQLQNIEGELSQRQTTIPKDPNPYKSDPQKKPVDEVLDPEKQKKELSKMYNAISGREF